MILIIGGFAQGKLHYVKQSYARCEDERKVAVLNGTLELPAETGALQVIVNHLHHYIREQLRQGRILEQLAAQADEVVRVVCGIGQKIK